MNRSRANILVVDDEESIRFTFENFLTGKGYHVTTAADFDDALNKISNNSFDLIFTDIILGGKSGIDLLQELKEKNTDCPVIIITGYPTADTASRAVRLGAFDYIFKPLRQEPLIHAADTAIKYRRLQLENDKYRRNLEAIFRSVTDAIITVDNNLAVLEINEAAEKICGLDRSILGKSLKSAMEECSPRCHETVKKVISKKKPFETFRIECSKRNDRRQMFTVTTSPLMDSSGGFGGAVLVIKDETRIHELEKNLGERRQYHNIIGRSEKLQKIYSLIEDLADVKTTVLITGESGTGKELVAEAIHYSNAEEDSPLVKVNCSALSESLLESELFGHVQGAFTGAVKDRAGRFRMADGGTIFLDEIGDISPGTQLRLLRFIQEKKFEPVGSSETIKADVRIISATNQDLERKVKKGEFREDLYYRLKVVEISLPPLRERKEDITLLTDYFIQKFNARFNKKIFEVSGDVRQIFIDYNWPGNIRELEHSLEHAFVTARKNILDSSMLPTHLLAPSTRKGALCGPEEDMTEQTLRDALKKAGWNKSKAARFLGINVRTVYRKMKKYGIEDENL